MTLQEAADNFRRSMTFCDNLVAVHRSHGGVRPGKRGQETAINRAVIVLTVASWQAVAQDLVFAALDIGSPGPGSPVSHATYGVIAGRVRKEVGDFSTPNAENTQRLFLGVGYDPRPLWTWPQLGGRGRSLILQTPHMVGQTMNDWLRLRHDIAHGHSSLTPNYVLQSVRQHTVSTTAWEPTLRLVDAETCMVFFRRIARLTGDGLAQHFAMPRPNW